jgi:alpha-beta hydrolase superfamily lysophospholipase
VTTKPPNETGFLAAADGTRLFHTTDAPEGDPRGVVMLLHGFAEHCGRYDGVVRRLVGLGLTCHRIDLRGHGRSGGRRGHVFAFGEYLSDVAALRAHVEGVTPAGLPVFLLGHSNGGLVALHALAERPDGLAGAALSSPFFGFGFEVPPLKAAAGRLLSRYLPALSLPTGLDAKNLSHDPAVVEGYERDPLVFHKASSRWFTETVAAHARLPEAAARVKLPLLMQIGGADVIASPAAARAVFEKIASPDKSLREYTGLYHEIWFEKDREPVLADLTAWLEPRLA